MSKKAKMTPSWKEEEEVWKKVEEWIRNCPHVTASDDALGENHPAIQAALKGLEQERKRRERDVKLQQKFATKTNTSPMFPMSSNSPQKSQNTIEESTNITMTSTNQKKAATESTTDDDTMLTDDWQDVNAEDKADADPNSSGAGGESGNSTSYLGDRLASEAVRLMAQHQVQVSSPGAALAAAFHAALLSCSAFVCTGVPEEGPSTGFAPPVRALGPDQFLPRDWDSKDKNRVVLRYRQTSGGSSVGSVVLKVELIAANGDPQVQVTWTPTKATSGEPQHPLFTFALGDHINLESWNRASQKSTVKTAPSLHYKGLAVLLTQFAQFCDLGDAMMQTDEASAADQQQMQLQQPYMDATIQQLPAQQQARVAPGTGSAIPLQPVLPQPISTGPYSDNMYHNRPGGYQVPTSLQDAFPGAYRGGLGVPGQFSGDLFPGTDSGNLMGPNHPAFRGDPGGLPGGYLQPRHDPFGPPQPDDDMRNGGRRPGRPADGTPNNDHFRPPNNLNNNMFM